MTCFMSNEAIIFGPSPLFLASKQSPNASTVYCLHLDKRPFNDKKLELTKELSYYSKLTYLQLGIPMLTICTLYSLYYIVSMNYTHWSHSQYFDACRNLAVVMTTNIF